MTLIEEIRREGAPPGSDAAPLQAVARQGDAAGEWITIAVMGDALRTLGERIDDDVPAQDLTVRLSRIPAIPQSRFVLRNVCAR